MTINEHIDLFLRDAQYRIAQLSVEIDELEDQGSYKYQELFRWRLELSSFMDVVYTGVWFITDGFNHIQLTDEQDTEEGWTESEVMQEIEYLRYYTLMNEAPFITFTGHYPQIVNPVSQTTGIGSVGNGVILPSGQPGMTVFYDASGQLYADSISPYSGHIDNESINAYFSGRL